MKEESKLQVALSHIVYFDMLSSYFFGISEIQTMTYTHFKFSVLYAHVAAITTSLSLVNSIIIVTIH